MVDVSLVNKQFNLVNFHFQLRCAVRQKTRVVAQLLQQHAGGLRCWKEGEAVGWKCRFYYIAFDCYKKREHKNINTISVLAAGRDFPGTSAGRPRWVPVCSPVLWFTGKKKSQPWKTSTTFIIKVNGCVPFLKRACASWILSRTVGHFSLVLAFGKNRWMVKIFAQLRVCMSVCVRMCVGVHAPFGYYEAMPRVQTLPYSKSLLLHCPDSRATPSWLCLEKQREANLYLKKLETGRWEHNINSYLSSFHLKSQVETTQENHLCNNKCHPLFSVCTGWAALTIFVLY